MQGPSAGPSSGLPPAVVNADRQIGIRFFPFTFMTLFYYFINSVWFTAFLAQQSVSYSMQIFFSFSFSFHSSQLFHFLWYVSLVFLVFNMAISG